MAEFLNPAFILIISAILVAFIENRVIRDLILILVPILVLLQVFSLREGEYWVIRVLDYELTMGKVDKLSLIFSYVFAIITFLSNVYALHVEERGHHVATFLYSGAAFGVIFAGDWITLIAFWELMAIASTFVILYGKKESSINAGFRYLIVHLIGGATLLAGALMILSGFGPVKITKLQEMNLSSFLILSGFLVNAACPPLHAWLPDAYPEANPAGSVFLSAYTTKSAVYILLRVFPGNEILVWAGAVMAVYGVFYAVMENNLRRLLSYHIVSQVGYMVCGAGLGTFMSMNGSVAHAFCHILYKALLFMAVGAVIFATGKEKISDLTGEGLYKKIPLTFYLYMVGAFSISGVPLFNGFVSKTIIVYSSGELHRAVINTLLHLASVGTFLSVALKLPYGTWFGKKSMEAKKRDLKIRRVPLNMYVSMAINSGLCVFTGVYPEILYKYLPYDATFNPYTLYNVATALQLFLFVFIGFNIFKVKLSPEKKISLDTDWFYRKLGSLFLILCLKGYRMRIKVQSICKTLLRGIFIFSLNPVNLKNLFLKKSKSQIMSYDPDFYRYPIGIGVGIFLLIYSLITIFLSRF
jgi:multicomponent Na+:H+ antiporter subunit D